jgi:hypothetical protein
MGHFALQRHALKATLGRKWEREYSRDGPLFERYEFGRVEASRGWYDEVNSSSNGGKVAIGETPGSSSSSSSSGSDGGRSKDCSSGAFISGQGNGSSSSRSSSRWQFWKDTDVPSTVTTSSTGSRRNKELSEQQQQHGITWKHPGGEEGVLSDIGMEFEVVKGPLGIAVPKVLVRGAASRNISNLPARIRQAMSALDSDLPTQCLAEHERAFDLAIAEEVDLGQLQQGACMFTALQLLLKVGLVEETWVVAAQAALPGGNTMGVIGNQKEDGDLISSSNSTRSSRAYVAATANPGDRSLSNNSSMVTSESGSRGGRGGPMMKWPNEEDLDCWPRTASAALPAGTASSQQQKQPVGFKGLFLQLLELPVDQQAQVGVLVSK